LFNRSAAETDSIDTLS